MNFCNLSINFLFWMGSCLSSWAGVVVCGGLGAVFFEKSETLLGMKSALILDDQPEIREACANQPNVTKQKAALPVLRCNPSCDLNSRRWMNTQPHQEPVGSLIHYTSMLAFISVFPALPSSLQFDLISKFVIPLTWILSSNSGPGSVGVWWDFPARAFANCPLRK